jgi:GGDEF domain-containing protein
MSLPKALFLGSDLHLFQSCLQELEVAADLSRVTNLTELRRGLLDSDVSVVLVDADESTDPLMQFLRRFVPEIASRGRNALILSSQFDRREEALALEAGAWSMLQKPVDPQLLRVHFRRALSARSAVQTGVEALPGYEKWKQSGQRVIERCVREGMGLGLVVNLVTRMRELNESHGAEQGDLFLQLFILRVREELGPHDLFGRCQGAAFATLIPGESFESVHARARALAKLAVSRVDQDQESPVSVAALIWRENAGGSNLDQMVREATRAARALSENEPGRLALRILRR